MASSLRTITALTCCASACSGEVAPRARATGLEPVAASITPDVFQQLRWIEGWWDGTEPGATPFFEHYAFLDDSTLRVYALSDTFTAAPRDSTLIALRGSTVTSERGDKAWVLTAIDSAGAEFSPVRGSRNRVAWRRDGTTRWTARLRWDSLGAERERSFEMRRLVPPS